MSTGPIHIILKEIQPSNTKKKFSLLDFALCYPPQKNSSLARSCVVSTSRRRCQVEAEYRAALKKGNVGKVAVSDKPQAKAIVEGFRM